MQFTGSAVIFAFHQHYSAIEFHPFFGATHCEQCFCRESGVENKTGCGTQRVEHGGEEFARIAFVEVAKAVAHAESAVKLIWELHGAHVSLHPINIQTLSFRLRSLNAASRQINSSKFESVLLQWYGQPTVRTRDIEQLVAFIDAEVVQDKCDFIGRLFGRNGGAPDICGRTFKIGEEPGQNLCSAFGRWQTDEECRALTRL